MKPDDRIDRDRLLLGMSPPTPPPELRKRVLAAAGSRAARLERPDLWARIWASRGLRLGWASAVLLLSAGHLALSLRPDAGVTTPRALLAAHHAGHQLLIDLSREKISASVQPMVGKSRAGDVPAELDFEGNPS
jgi:hypothetical protein